MAVGLSAVLDAATLNGTLGASALSLKTGIDDLVTQFYALEDYEPAEMIAPPEEGGLGLDMTLEDAQAVKSGLAQCPSLQASVNAARDLAKFWGLGVA